MPSDAWQAAILRWGDALYALALLLADDREVALRQTVASFARVLAAPPDDIELALVRDLLARRWRRRRLGQQHELPLRLRRLAPHDRALLALWLLRNHDGARLAAMSRSAVEELPGRLERALRHLMADDLARFFPSSSTDAWRGLIAAELGLAAADGAPPQWSALLNAARGILRGAIGRVSLPPLAREEIEEAILSRREALATPWWRRPAGTLAVLLAGVAVWALLVIAPWRGARPPATAERLSPRELVSGALEAWATAPISGTLHQRVWARDPLALGPRDEWLTDVWIEAGGARHRVETRRGSDLVEWQLGDGRDTLLYATTPGQATCRWPDLPLLSSSRGTQPLEATPAQQTAALRARLTLGGYGVGYEALRGALEAVDLRSFGARVERGTALVILAYTDRRVTPPRQLLVWIDPATRDLHRVQEIVAEGGQTRARDLWRLQQRETLPAGLSQRRPEWPRIAGQRRPLVDPGCLALQPGQIVSLRRLVGFDTLWSVPWLPASPPAGIREAILVTPDGTYPETPSSSLRAVLLGPDRWLSLRLATQQVDDPLGQRHGDRLVRLRQEQGRWSGTICWQPQPGPICGPVILIAASGWTEAELLALIETLTPVNPRTWLALDDLFIDPRPLPSELAALLRRGAQAWPVADGRFVSRARIRQYHAAPPLSADDPYAVPAALLRPEQVEQTLWLEQRNGYRRRFCLQTRLPDGTLLAAECYNGRHQLSYDARQRLAWQSSLTDAEGIVFGYVPRAPDEQVLALLIAADPPPQVQRAPDGWVLMYAIPEEYSRIWYALIDVSAEQPRVMPAGLRAQVWLDPASALPRRLALFASPDGVVQPLATIVFDGLRPLAAGAPDPFVLPALPNDAFVFETGQNAVRLLQPGAALDPPTRFLMWPATAGITIVDDRRPSLAQLGRSDVVAQSLFSGLAGLEEAGLVRSTVYELATTTGSRRVTVRQGNRLLLGQVLRIAASVSEGLRQSRSVPVVLAGQARTAWLISDGGQALLVVPWEESLLVLSGPDAATLAGEVAAALARMVVTTS